MNGKTSGSQIREGLQNVTQEPELFLVISGAH